MPHHLFPSSREPYAGADRVAIAFGPNQLQLDRIACFLQVVQIKHWGVIVRIHDQVQPSVVVEVGHCNTTAVLRIIRTGWPCNIDELPVPDIRKETLVLVTVPGVLTDKLVTEEEPLFVLVNVRDRARCKRESKIVLVLVCDPAIRRIDIKIRVVVGIEESDTPPPARARCMTVFQLAKRAVAVVLEE